MASPSLPSSAIAALVANLHPFAPPAGKAISPVGALRVECSALPDSGAGFTFTLQGQIDALRVPAGEAPAAWPLWQHTCFEAFLSVSGQERYREYNFSPARLWAASAFRRYREIERDLSSDAPPPVIETKRRGNTLLLAARLPRALLPDGLLLRVGLAAVVERRDGQLEYWALHHPVAGCADFHHQDGWTLRLATRQVSP